MSIHDQPMKTQKELRREFSAYFLELKAAQKREGGGVGKNEEWKFFVEHQIEEGDMNREHETALRNFKRCAEDAPAGTYEEAKQLNKTIGDACDELMRNIRTLGLKADACDLIFAVEAAMYDYVKKSNLAGTLFPVAEGFGAAMDSPARDRVIAQATRDKNFLEAHRKTTPE